MLQILDIGYEEQGVFAIVPAGARVINGLVQSAAVRSAGFYVVVGCFSCSTALLLLTESLLQSLYDTAPALHILYLFMSV